MRLAFGTSLLNDRCKITDSWHACKGYFNIVENWPEASISVLDSDEEPADKIGREPPFSYRKLDDSHFERIFATGGLLQV